MLAYKFIIIVKYEYIFSSELFNLSCFYRSHNIRKLLKCAYFKLI